MLGIEFIVGVNECWNRHESLDEYRAQPFSYNKNHFCMQCNIYGAVFCHHETAAAKLKGMESDVLMNQRHLSNAFSHWVQRGWVPNLLSLCQNIYVIYPNPSVVHYCCLSHLGWRMYTLLSGCSLEPSIKKTWSLRSYYGMPLRPQLRWSREIYEEGLTDCMPTYVFFITYSYPSSPGFVFSSLMEQTVHIDFPMFFFRPVDLQSPMICGKFLFCSNFGQKWPRSDYCGCDYYSIVCSLGLFLVLCCFDWCPRLWE